MPEPLKNRYNRDYLQQLAQRLQREWPHFKHEQFVEAVLSGEWSNLELKSRMRRITLTINEFLPSDYSQSVAILCEVSRHFSGFEAMFFPDYVECFGLAHFDESVKALAIMTQYSSSEFAVRPFIVQYPERMMQQMRDWSRSDNHHVRRLASEGCRPRLPWAMALPDFKRDPSPIFPILHELRGDPSDYVYRSVANNLNDISRDHPDQVLELASRWRGHSKTTDWVVKHACRTLLKKGDRRAMTLFGFAEPEHIRVEDFQIAGSVQRGDSLEFSFRLQSEDVLGSCRLEYAVHFLRANGQHSLKVFKISERQFTRCHEVVTRSHSFRPITTRRYYPGRQKLDIRVNGAVLAEAEFDLI